MLGKQIGEGRTAQIFEYRDDKVVKLLYKEFDKDLEQELKFCQTICNSSVPTPMVYGSIEHDGRRGIIFDKAQGHDLGEALSLYPHKVTYLAKQAAKTQLQINSIANDDLPDQHDMFHYKINKASCLTQENRRKILAYTTTLPRDNRICHGDLHIKNYIYSKKTLLAIDWVSSYSGHPAGDVARTILTMNSPVFTGGLPFIQKSFVKFIISKYNRIFYNSYLQAASFNKCLVNKFMLPIAAIRLTENVPYEKEWLSAIINQGIQELSN